MALQNVVANLKSNLTPTPVTGPKSTKSPNKVTAPSVASRIWVNPTGGKVRGQDGYGCGSFGPVCSRSNYAGGHQGTDYESVAGQDVLAMTSGKITKINSFTSKDLSLMYVQIETSDGYVIRQGYINPVTVSVDDIVEAGDVIGNAASLQNAYPLRSSGSMTDHVHVDIEYQGKRINPQGLAP